MSDILLDLRGLKCPMPVLRTRKALAGLPGHAVLRIECTDPLSAIDLPHLLRETGDDLVGRSVENGVLTFHVRKAASTES